MDEELYAFDQCTTALRTALTELRECKSNALQVQWVKALAMQKRDQLIRQVNEQLDNVTFVCKSVMGVAPEPVVLQRRDAVHVMQIQEEDEPSVPSPIPSPIITRKRKSHYVPVPEEDDEDDEDEMLFSSSDSSFIEEDKSEGDLPIFDDPVFDDIFAGRPPATKHRVHKKAERFSPPPEKKLTKEEKQKEKEEEEDVSVGSTSRYDQDAAQLFLVRAPILGLRDDIADSFWFRDRYSSKLDQIRNNLGLQKADSIAHQTWDCMYNCALDQRIVSGVELNNYKRKDTCCLCGYQRQCTYTIKLPDNTRGLLGDKCAGLAFAWNGFLSTLIDVEKFASGKDFMKQLDLNMLDLQQAQENKTLEK